MTLREKVAKYLVMFDNGCDAEKAEWYWDTVYEKCDHDDLFAHADAILALLSTADSEQRETPKADRWSDWHASWLSVGAVDCVPDAEFDAVVADLRKAEATRPAEQQDVAALRNEGDFLAIAAERDDLRRKLEEANLENGRLLNDRKVFAQMLNESERERAASSLANAALRTALEGADWLLVRSQPGPSSNLNGEKMWYEKRDQLHVGIVALPADSIAQEVVGELREARHFVDIDERKSAIETIDALLARLGVPK